MTKNKEKLLSFINPSFLSQAKKSKMVKTKKEYFFKFNFFAKI